MRANETQVPNPITQPDPLIAKYGDTFRQHIECALDETQDTTRRAKAAGAVAMLLRFTAGFNYPKVLAVFRVVEPDLDEATFDGVMALVDEVGRG